MKWAGWKGFSWIIGLLKVQRDKSSHWGGEEIGSGVCYGSDGEPGEGDIGDPRGTKERKESFKEDRVRPDVRYCDVDSEGDYPGTLETQRRQSFPPIAYRRPIPGTGSNGFAPVLADVGQGDDWPGIAVGDECGAQGDDFRRETVHRL